MGVKFVGNTGTKTLHALGFTDGRCRIGQIRAERKVEFATLEDAMNFPEGGSPIFHECGVCFPKMKEALKKSRGSLS